MLLERTPLVVGLASALALVGGGAAGASGYCSIEWLPTRDLPTSLAAARQAVADGCSAAVHDHAQELLQRAERERGAESSEVADALDLLAETQVALSRTDEAAISRARRSLAIRLRRTDTPIHALAQTHTRLGALLADRLDDSVQMDEALDHFETARQLWIEAAGPHSLQVADMLAWIAESIDDWGGSGLDWTRERAWIADILAEGSEARTQLEAAVALLEERLPAEIRGRLTADRLRADPGLAVALVGTAIAQRAGQESAIYARNLNILGNLLNRRQQYDEALVAFDESLRVRLHVLRPGHPQIARGYHNRGEARMLVGDYAGALPDAEIAYRERLALAGDRFPGVIATSLQLLGTLRSLTGDTQGALELYRGALPRLCATYGEAHWRCAEGSLSLAEFYEALDQPAAAERHYRAALASLTGSVSPEGARTARAQSRYGRLRAHRGDPKGGLRLLTQARITQERLPTLPLGDYAETLGNLAEIAEAQGRFDDALDLRHRTLETLNRYQGLHPALLDALLAAARIELRLGHSTAAEQTLARAGSVVPTLGEAAYVVRARFHELRGRLYRTIGRPDSALDEAIHAADLYARHLVPASRLLPSEAALQFTQQGRASLDLALTLLADSAAAPEKVLAVWETVAAQRNLVTDELRRRHRSTQGDLDEVGEAKQTALREAQRHLAHEQLRPSRVATPRERSRLLAYAEARVQQAERDLAEHLAVGRRSEPEAPGLSEALRNLPEGTALVSFLRFGGSGGEQPARYGAFTALSEPGAVSFVPLGDAEEVDRIVHRWRSTLLDLGESWALSEAKLRFSGEELRRKVWEPVVRTLGDSRKLRIVPDGSLFFVPLAALPSRDRRHYLIEDGYQIDYLVAERDLTHRRGAGSLPSRLLAVGGPDFDAGSQRAAAPRAAKRRPSASGRAWQEIGAALAMALRDPCQGADSLYFRSLPDATAELADIETIFRAGSSAPFAESAQISSLSAAAATEESFKRLAPGHSILHLATHSFFDIRCRRAGMTRRVQDLLGTSSEAQQPFSGLALAGANLYRHSADPGNDGIMSVSEIAGLDLSQVDWVILSACETGLGQVVAGEGLLGLARGFRVAGAGSLVLSLWPVEDRATREWMRELYRARFERGEEKAAAVHSAALTILERRRSQGEATHPFFWAAFVGVGN